MAQKVKVLDPKPDNIALNHRIIQWEEGEKQFQLVI